MQGLCKAAVEIFFWLNREKDPDMLTIGNIISGHIVGDAFKLLFYKQMRMCLLGCFRATGLRGQTT